MSAPEPNAVAFASDDRLPALIDRAASVLADARSAAEILEALSLAGVAYEAAKLTGRFARAKNAGDALIAAAHRIQADALEIEAGAKRRLADEYDAAQERGEVARLGSNQTQVGVPDGNTLATAADLGLTRKGIHEAREIRDAEVADPGVVRRALDEKLARGEEPTKASVKSAVAKASGKTAAKSQRQLRKEWREQAQRERAEHRKQRREEREAQQAEHDRQRDNFAATLPPSIQAAEAAKEANRQKTREQKAAGDDESGLSTEGRIAELEEAVRVLTVRNADLEAENKTFGEMKESWKQGGFEKVVADRDEALRVARERIHSENHDKIDWKRQADYWHGQAIKLGWKSGDLKIDNKTGELRHV